MRNCVSKSKFRFSLVATMLVVVAQTAFASNITIDDAATNLVAFAYTQANSSELRSQLDGVGSHYYRSTDNATVRGSVTPGSAFAQISPTGGSTTISTGVATFAVPGTIDDIAEAHAIVYFTVSHDTLFTLTDSADISTPIGQQGGDAYGFNVFGLEDAAHNNIIQVVSYGGVQSFTGILHAGMEYDFYGESQCDERNGDSRLASAGNIVTLTTGDEVLNSGQSNPSTIPEPSSLALLCIGGFGLAVSAYRRRRAAD